MKRVGHASRAVLMLACWLIAGWTAWAQELVEGPVPPEYDTGSVEDWVTPEERKNSRFYVGRFQDTYSQDLEFGAISGVAEDLIQGFRELDWGANQPQHALILRHLAPFLGDLEFALRTPGIVGPLDLLSEQDAFLRAFNSTSRGVQTLQLGSLRLPGQEDDVPGYFGNRSEAPGDWLPLYLYDDAESELRDADVYRLTLARRHMRDWRLLEQTLSELLNSQIGVVRQENVRFLEHQVERWENYLDRGYSQMPWESLFNGYVLSLPEHGPPDRQWILLHPSLGIEASTSSIDDIRVKESLQVELLGHIWYRGDDLDNYWGVSASASFREDLDPGLGVLVHLRRHWSLGVTWHDFDEDPYLFLSVDLFRFARRKAPVYVERYEDLRQLLGQ